MALRYRFRTPDDDESLLQLWCKFSGWDQLEMQTWRHRFLETPLGEADIVVAEDDGGIVAQHVFFPCLVRVGDEVVKAVRPFAPIVSPDYRGSIAGLIANPTSHPVVATFRHGAQELGKRGVELLFMMPDPMWARLFKVFPALQTSWFQLFSRPLPLEAAGSLDDGYTVRPLEDWNDERIDRLEETSARHYGCSLVRNRLGLPWKLSHQPYEVQLVERGDELVGLVASIQKGDRQWLICDMLVADNEDSLRATLTGVTNLADEKSRQPGEDKPVHKVAILATEPMKPVLTELGFAKDKYRFPLVIQRLGEQFTRDQVAPDNWYGAAND